MDKIDKKLNKTYSMKVIISFALGNALYTIALKKELDELSL